MTAGFRERDGGRVTYDVRGIPGRGDCPYVNDIPSLKEAVAIGRSYPEVYGDGASTQIVRNYAKLFPVGSEFHHRSGATHRWRVMPDGAIQLMCAYSRPWPTSRVGRNEFIGEMKRMPYPAHGAHTQLSDLASVARQLGLEEAHRELREFLRAKRYRSNTDPEPLATARDSGRDSVDFHHWPISVQWVHRRLRNKRWLVCAVVLSAIIVASLFLLLTNPFGYANHG